jgi:hypothetical protein
MLSGIRRKDALEENSSSRCDGRAPRFAGRFEADAAELLMERGMSAGGLAEWSAADLPVRQGPPQPAQGRDANGRAGGRRAVWLWQRDRQ